MTALSVRRVAVHGRDAVAWLAARGLETSDRRAAGMSLYADEFSTPDFAVRRVWHSPVDLRGTGLRGHGARSVLLTLNVQGGPRRLTGDGAGIVLVDGSAAAAAPSEPYRLQCSAPTARIEVLTPVVTGAWAPPGCGETRFCEPGAALWTPLASHVAALLGVDPPGPGVVERLLVSSTQALASALLVDSLGGAPAAPSESRSDALFARADALMRSRSHDPRLTLDGVAEELGVSRRYLSAVFAARGLAPSGHLRDVRLDAARSVLARRSGPTAVTEAAREAGFTSARALRDAMRRASHGSQAREGDALPATVPGSDALRRRTGRR